MSDLDKELTRLFIKGQRRLDEARNSAERKFNATATLEPPVMPDEGGMYPAPNAKREDPLDRLKRINRGSTHTRNREEDLSDDELGGHTRESFNRLPPARRLQIANEVLVLRRQRS